MPCVTSVLSRAMAHIDGRSVDPELLHICSLLHDTGLMRHIAGEDFTLRSAAAARGCACTCTAHEPVSVGKHMADVLMVHTTVGVTPEQHGVREVPGGRFDFAVRAGFGLAVRLAPFPT